MDILFICFLDNILQHVCETDMAWFQISDCWNLWRGKCTRILKKNRYFDLEIVARFTSTQLYFGHSLCDWYLACHSNFFFVKVNVTMNDFLRRFAMIRCYHKNQCNVPGTCHCERFLGILKSGNTLRVFNWSSKTCNNVAWIFSSQPVFGMKC